MRSPATAALMGVFESADFGADFGGFGGFGIEGDLAAADRSAMAERQQWRAGHLGTAGVLASDVHHLRMSSRQIEQLRRDEQREATLASRERARLDMLDPNEGLAVKISRYSFSLNQQLVIGTATGILATLQPDTKIRPQRVVMNAPTYGFITVTTIKVANVSVLVGGSEDAFTYSALSVGIHLDMPTLDPSNRATVQGNYAGLAPPPFAVGYPFLFVTTLQGPATVTAGG